MTYHHGRLIKAIDIPGAGCIHIVTRQDGVFQFHERILGPDGVWETASTSGGYISAETAEKAARLKFKL